VVWWGSVVGRGADGGDEKGHTVPQLTRRDRLPEVLAHLQRRVGFENGAELASTTVIIFLPQIALAGLLSRLRDGLGCRCRHRLGRVGRRLEWRGPTDAICAYDSRRVGQGRLSSQPFMLLLLLLALHRVGESTLGVGRLRRRSCLAVAVARSEATRGDARRGEAQGRSVPALGLSVRVRWGKPRKKGESLGGKECQQYGVVWPRIT